MYYNYIVKKQDTKAIASKSKDKTNTKATRSSMPRASKYSVYGLFRRRLYDPLAEQTAPDDVIPLGRRDAPSTRRAASVRKDRADVTNSPLYAGLNDEDEDEQDPSYLPQRYEAPQDALCTQPVDRAAFATTMEGSFEMP